MIDRLREPTVIHKNGEDTGPINIHIKGRARLSFITLE